MHWISGLIGDRAVLEAIAGENELDAPAQLEHGLGFLPLDERNLAPLVGQDAVFLAFGEDREDGSDFRHLTPELLAWCAARATTVPLAYVETEYFGGMGGQGAAIFDKGLLVWGPELGEIGPINAALARLGVKPGAGDHDAFEAVGLGRCRSNDSWRELPS